MIFGNKSKVFRTQKRNFDEMDRRCKNAAWDLTYLSLWSTLYYFEEDSEEVFLFATLDKELKDLFFLTHKESLGIYKEVFGIEIGQIILDNMSNIYLERISPNIDTKKLDKMITEERNSLKNLLNINAV